MKKKIVALALAVATVCSVTACGEKKENKKEKSLRKLHLCWTGRQIRIILDYMWQKKRIF